MYLKTGIIGQLIGVPIGVKVCKNQNEHVPSTHLLTLLLLHHVSQPPHSLRLHTAMRDSLFALSLASVK
jgi:hypothetical protein